MSEIFILLSFPKSKIELESSDVDSMILSFKLIVSTELSLTFTLPLPDMDEMRINRNNPIMPINPTINMATMLAITVLKKFFIFLKTVIFVICRQIT